MRFTSLLPLLFAITVSATAAPVDSMSARLTAARFLAAGTGGAGGVRPKAVNTLAATLRQSRPARTVYLFAAPDGRYILTAADDALPAVVGYGTCGPGPLPAALRDWLDGLDRYAKKGVRSATPGGDGGPVVAPLLTAVRHQKSPYNAYCPRYIADDGTQSDGRCVVGCVATAAEEVISHYRRIITLRDTLKGWTTPHFSIPDVPPGTTVDTRLIRDNYDVAGTYTAEEADAVAHLSYLLGVAVRMRWGLIESGARLRDLEQPLRRAFGFGYVHYADSYKYRPADWLAMLRAELRAGRPVVYAGFAMRLNGHAFVLDGLDADGLFHVNWGVDGDYDGYFRLDILNAAEPCYDTTATGAYEGFFTNQEALFIHPDALPDQRPDTLTRTGKEVKVDAVEPELPPVAGRLTPLRLHLRNVADYATTSPIELLVNTPTDSAIFEQADYVALTGVTLAPGETRIVPVAALFSRPGRFALRLSPDDEHVIFTDSIDVTAAPGAALSFATPTLSFPAPGRVCITQPITNAANAGRAGGKVTYELFEGTPRYDHNGTAHADYCYLAPGASETDSVCFSGLRPGTPYTLYVRYPWAVVHELHFTLPTITGIRSVFANSPATAPVYDLSGRRIGSHTSPGLRIVGGKKVMVTSGR